jgi:hypothetical protein
VHGSCLNCGSGKICSSVLDCDEVAMHHRTDSMYFQTESFVTADREGGLLPVSPLLFSLSPSLPSSSYADIPPSFLC